MDEPPKAQGARHSRLDCRLCARAGRGCLRKCGGPAQGPPSWARIVYETVSVPLFQVFGSPQGITTTLDRYNDERDTNTDRPPY